jgi:hypothetical protein
MIHVEQYSQALRALQRLIVHAKSQAYQAGESRLAELLNDMELLPEYLVDERDRTGEFVEMLHGIAQVNPSCLYIIEEFDNVSTSFK